MADTGTVEGIYTTPDSGERMQEIDTVEAIAGQGLRGDRYFRERGLYDRRDDLPEGTDVTLIEAEALEAASRDDETEIRPEDTRRNLLTRGVPLNHLVDREFQVGETTLVGVRLCEPCSYMESLARTEGAVSALVHRGGLNANVVDSGTISTGDAIDY
ncbi:MOSC domain-containing protein [Natrarchaeobius sp. A-rgal3]|uniref:MOSC domain-containing protein n=1 Tax=Natrarchaeobius versutus TaxID=1679078 RepID=UPI00350F7C31